MLRLIQLEETLASLSFYLYNGNVMNTARDSDVSLETVVADLALAVGRLLRRLRSEANPSELNLSQMGALARLEQIGPMTTADLARAESMKPQSMGTVLVSLEQERLVQRQAHPTDGRQVLFALTERGLHKRRQRRIAKRDWLVAAAAKLDPTDLQTLAAAIPLIRRIAES
jgi:DNA-binding MarR family transcriptional regulator